MNITERKYLNLFDNFVSSIVILDKDLRIVFFNKPFCQLTGYNMKRIKKGSSLFNFFPLEKGKELFTQVVTTGQMSANIELESTDKDGQHIKVLTNIIPLETEDSTVGILLNMIDISVEDRLHKKYKKLLDLEVESKKDMRMQLIQAEKMASLGTLLAGISHELNNPLAIAIGSIELIKSKGPQPNEELLNSIMDATRRMSVIVNKLRIFSRKANDEFEFVYINKVIEDIFLLFNKKLEDEKVIIKKNLCKENPKILGDENLIGQVIMNLLTNAVDAMETTERKDLTVTTTLSGEIIDIIISDTGIGINEDIKNNIFDPFFTTKAPNKGTGLGLSIIYQILKLHNSSIQMLNNPSGGASFGLKMNAILPDNKGAAAVVEDKYKDIKNLSVLFVDDEENLLKLIEYMFKEYLGNLYAVSSASAALKLLKEKKVDVLVSDVRMPEMDGYELAKQVRQSFPTMPRICLSGSPSVKTDDSKNEFFEMSISKPFNKEEVLQALLNVAWQLSKK